jgi:TAT-translocated FGD2 family F420-dependent dehydrogenase
MQQGKSGIFANGQVGFVLSQEQFPVPRLIELGTQAEQAGFNAVWSSDHFQPWQDNEGHAGSAWVTLAALTQRLKRAVIGTGVTCPTYRYRPAIVAQAWASLSLLYPGRVFLGVGTGEALNEQAAGGGWGEYEERAERWVEAIQLIRELWKGELINHKGKYWEVNAKLYDVPAQPIPIYTAASGEHSLELAGKNGDGLISDTKTVLDPKLMQHFQNGARQAGKDPNNMPVITEQWVIVGNEQEAQRWAKLWQFLPHAWDKFVTNPDPRDIQKQAEKDVPIQETYKDWAIGSDPQVHIQKLQKLFEAGVTQVFVHSPQPDQEMVIDFYQREVLPKVQGAFISGSR